ncbi:preprotein translocase subunit SecY [Tomitella biformata]|uniref:preprotein translocase subunit SecY n=1 Tax=Tomitella biformata TaxID=630403 RepID=UPI00046318F7|nr:preprotein translocase subunit SecY [Tomitella biformata]
MLSAFGSAFRTPDLRRKILFTLALIVLYRVGAMMPSPGVNFKNIQECSAGVLDSDTSGVYSLINLFSGGALLQLSVFAIGIMPYITASIIVQLLTVVIPKFEDLRKEGQSGQAKMTQYTRYITVALALLQSTGFVALAKSGNLLQGCDKPILADESMFGLLVIVLVMSSGGILLMWMGELITEKGVGNGMSILIFISIGAGLPGMGKAILDEGGLRFTLVMFAVLAILVGVVFIEQGQRRIPVQYAKRMVGRRMYGGSSTYLPLKVNQAGVIPVIFASSLLYLPTLISQLTRGDGADPHWWNTFLDKYFANPQSTGYIVIYFLLILFFTYFYVAITFNPEERADEMKKYGGFIPGIRPGGPTVKYLQFVLNRITLVGALYLGGITILPNFFLGAAATAGMAFGGTSILILVVVALDTSKQIESQLLQRNYEGFLR